MNASKCVLFSSNPNTSLWPLYIFPIKILLQHLLSIPKPIINCFYNKRSFTSETRVRIEIKMFDLDMIWWEWKPDGPHKLLRERLLTSRPTENIYYTVVWFCFVTVWRKMVLWLVVIDLHSFLWWVLLLWGLECLHSLLSSETELIPICIQRLDSAS